MSIFEFLKTARCKYLDTVEQITASGVRSSTETVTLLKIISSIYSLDCHL